MYREMRISVHIEGDMHRYCSFLVCIIPMFGVVLFIATFAV